MSMIGKLPPEISRLTRLSLIDFGQNDISGEIPSTWGHLTNMGKYGENLYLVYREYVFVRNIIVTNSVISSL